MTTHSHALFFLSLTHTHEQRQRDPRLNEILFPFFNEKRVKQIIDTYDTSEENQEKGEA